MAVNETEDYEFADPCPPSMRHVCEVKGKRSENINLSEGKIV